MSRELPRIKICGLTRMEDAELAASLGAWALGFIFYSKSPRAMTPRRAMPILSVLRQRYPAVLRVGVFVDETVDEVARVAQALELTHAQLHGAETPAYCRELRARMPKLGVIKAFRPKTRADLDQIPEFEKISDAILLDAYVPGHPGGTGTLGDWTLAQVAARSGIRVVLAGGLGPDNLTRALSEVEPYALDASSLLEDSPGIKSSAKLRKFFERARAQGRAEEMSMESKSAHDPDENGWFGPFGGRFAPETLMEPLRELERAFFRYRREPEFVAEKDDLLNNFVGRETPLTFAARLSGLVGGARIYLKREDLTHTGAHKINNAVGQILLARRMGKKRIIAETGAGQHGVATATVAAHFGLECVVYMGRVDMERQAPNVHRMQILGARVVPVDAGTRTLKDAVSEAMRDWVTHVQDSYYLLGSALGPHPYPLMVREFQSVIGREARLQFLEFAGRLPDELIACVGGGSNAIGFFHAFLDDLSVRMTGVEAGGRGTQPGEHAARFAGGSIGVLQGTQSYILQDEGGQIENTHSVSAGLDYAAVGPEHAWLREKSRVQYTSITDEEALAAFHRLARVEGIIPALESSHAVAYALKRARELSSDQILGICLSGRGDKDLATVMGAVC